MNQTPKPIAERKVIVDLMNEVVALNQRVPNCSKKIYNAFMAIYYHLDHQLEKV